WPAPAIVCAAVWAAITAGFCAKRLRGTQLTPSHVAEMIVTSIAIPPVSLYWRMRQYSDTGGIAMDVTIISATCDGVSCVPRNRFAQNPAVIAAHTAAHTMAGAG
ncbi:hypothetical protein QM312_36955, partial [Burkholderia cenocepacia]|nr:hypothetical protein [Burkholderia cenocepacia]